MSKNKNRFYYECHYIINKDFYDKMITNVELRNYLIVKGKSFSECVKSHAVNNVAHLKINGVDMCIYTGVSPISHDKLTKQRIIAGAHRANFLDKNSKVVSSLLARINITEFEEDFPGISRLLGCGFHFQRQFIETHFSNPKYREVDRYDMPHAIADAIHLSRYGYRPKRYGLADVLAFVGCATLDYSAFLSSKQALKFEHIDDLWTFLTFVDKHPEQEMQQFKQSVSALSRQIQNPYRILEQHESVIQHMCLKIKGIKSHTAQIIDLFSIIVRARAPESDDS